MKTPIIQLLLDCLHQDRNRVSADRLATQSAQEWETLFVLAKEQRVAALLFHRLKSGGLISGGGEEVLIKLRDFYKQNTLRNMSLFGELHRVAKALQFENIPVILLKGMHLATVVYDNMGLREMNDIDLMVPAENLSRAGKSMIKLGYQPQNKFNADIDSISSHHLPRFIKSDISSIEIHWNITGSGCYYFINPAPLWKHAISVSIAGVDLLGLSQEDLLLHLCLHTSYQHQFQFGLRPFCDIAQLTRHYSQTLNWPIVHRRAVNWGWKKGVFLALTFAKDLLGAEVPEAILDQLRPSDFTIPIEDTALRLLFTNKAFAGSISGEAAKVFHRKQLPSKLRGMLGRVFLPKETMAYIYGLHQDSIRLYLYYAVRLKDLIVRYFRIIGALYRGKQETVTLIERKGILANWLDKG